MRPSCSPEESFLLDFKYLLYIFHVAMSVISQIGFRLTSDIAM